MSKEIFNGKREQVSRIYGTLKYFVGENRTYKRGDLLCVSTRNDEDYDLVITADGERNFNALYQACLNGKGNKNIEDKSVGKDDLSEDVQASLDKADSAYVKPQTGIPAEDLSAEVLENLGDLTPEASEADVVAMVTEYDDNQ